MDNGDIDASASQSTSTIREAIHIDIPLSSQPSSPRSSALPSPPDSPGSTSSFPSLSSSFFLSSADASPPHAAVSNHAHDSTAGLIIPSLALTDALRQPTAFGKTLAHLRLIVLGDCVDFLLEDNDDIVHIAEAEPTPIAGTRFLRASTDWIEHSDAHGLDRFEPIQNIEILEIPRVSGNLVDLTEHLLTLVHIPFKEVHDLLDPSCPSASSHSTLLTNLVASPTSPLFTALVVLSSGLSTQERALITTLGEHIPIVLIPPVAGAHTRKPLPLSSIRPPTPLALRALLFRSPEILNQLRLEAADRFFAWRKGELSRSVTPASSWDKAAWEADCVTYASYARRSNMPSKLAPCLPLDPLHIPSLFMFSVSLFDPVRVNLSGRRLGLTLLSTLCIGFGIGLGLGVHLRTPSGVLDS